MTDTKVIDLDEKRWQKEFNHDLQKAFEEVVNVLHGHLQPEVANTVAMAISKTLTDIGEGILESIPDIPESPNPEVS